MSLKILIDEFKLFATGNPGIESFVVPEASPTILNRLINLPNEAIPKVQLNQLLVLSQESGMSDGFFHYYWLETPKHCYNIKSLPEFDDSFKFSDRIESLQQLKWGMYRIYVDGLLFLGNVRNFYRAFCSKTREDIAAFFDEHRIDTDAVKKRGPALPLETISKDNRYLISEMACKSYGATPETESELKNVLLEAFEAHSHEHGSAVTIRALLDGSYIRQKYANQNQMWLLSADDILNEQVSSIEQIETKYSHVAKQFLGARNAALENTRRYLSMVNDLDVYVATSMRSRDDFRKMATDCEVIFSDPRLKSLHLRYFDPTLSAAEGHQDKGVIECLMVKCSKVLVYCAGQKESYGKDAEAAMALSLGKPVIFYCDEDHRKRFYRDIHPLSRLIHFETGVVVGAIVTDRIETVRDVLNRLFENTMEYVLEQPKTGYLQLKEKLTDSVVRLQTNDKLLAAAFDNYYQTRH